MMTTLFYIFLGALWLFFVLRPKQVYDKLWPFAGGIWVPVVFQADNPRMLVMLHAIWVVVGCVFLFLAVWGNAHNHTYTDITNPGYSFLIRNPELTERQVIFRLNCYHALGGVICFLIGLIGVVRPGTIMGFTLVWP